jgi:hypothetical protein
MERKTKNGWSSGFYPSLLASSFAAFTIRDKNAFTFSKYSSNAGILDCFSYDMAFLAGRIIWEFGYRRSKMERIYRRMRTVYTIANTACSLHDSFRQLLSGPARAQSADSRRLHPLTATDRSGVVQSRMVWTMADYRFHNFSPLREHYP